MTLIDWLSVPAVIYLLGAITLAFLPDRVRPWISVVVPILAFAVMWALPIGTTLASELLRLDLVILRVDQLSKVFGAIFIIISFGGAVYAWTTRERAHQAAALVYAGGALGVTFAGDYLTLFVFWEMMALASTVLIAARRTAESRKAAVRYFIVHLAGGSVLLSGILLNIRATGSILLGILVPDGSLSSWLLLTGVALNAAIPPLHAWLSDAYPKATVAGAVFLSAFTTKAAVYVLVRVFPGWESLLVLGVVMALYGVVFAVLANDIREILAYHIISQVGYMVAGVGIGTELALNGTTAHAFSHILYKALLFMGAGAVIHATGRSKLTELGGLWKSMPVTVVLYMVGAFSISGFPLFNGFISKSMVVSAAGKAHLDTAMLLLHLASVGTFLHTGLKLPYFTWFGPASAARPAAVPRSMHVAMGFVAALCMLFGIAPTLLYEHLPFSASYEPYTIPHLVETAQLLTFTFVAFWIYRAKVAGENTLTLDADWIYRRPAAALRRVIIDGVGDFFDGTERWTLAAAARMVILARNPFAYLWARSSGSAQPKVLEEYDPDVSRPRMAVLVGSIISIFIVIALLALIL